MTLAEKVNVTTGTGWSMGLAVGNTAPAIHVGFPGLALQDGPLGVRYAHNITAFPAGITVGATFNKDLMYARGKAHGLEARGKGINAILGPCVGPLGRAPAGGRNWEGFGADPYLQGVAGSQTIKGIQDQHVMATIKHFVGNEQEHFRQQGEPGTDEAMSANIDDRALHELYVWPFADAVKAGVASVMCSYNQVNNSYSCQNSKLLNGVLKDELGFQGFVMSDWLAQRSGVASALAGLDMSMPGDGAEWADGESFWGPKLSEAVLNGTLPLSRLNDMVTRIVATWYQLGQDDEKLFDRKGPNFSSWTESKKDVPAFGSTSKQDKVTVNQFINVQSNHSLLVRQIAAEGTVLVKNVDGFLPLSKNQTSLSKDIKRLRVGVFGEDAGPGDGPNVCVDRGCNDGTLGSGWGSGSVNFPHLITPIQALERGFSNATATVKGYLTNTIKYANNSEAFDQDICIAFVNSDSGEGYLTWEGIHGDRNDLSIQKGGDDLIKEVATHCGGHGNSSTIVVVHAVGPVDVESWIGFPGVKAVLLANLLGQESGYSIADIIFGDVNPSGKLPYTVGKSLSDYGPGGQIMYKPNEVIPQVDFDEGLYIDYRYFDKNNIVPRFEFGFGMSYTTFNYSNLKISEQKQKSLLAVNRTGSSISPPSYSTVIPDTSEAQFPSHFRELDDYIYPYFNTSSMEKSGDNYTYPVGFDVEQPLSPAGGDEGGNPDLWETYVSVSVDITNTGSLKGQAVPQLYMSYPNISTSDIDFPIRVLRGFEKVSLEAGNKTTVEFNVTRRDVSYWDVGRQNWAMVTDGEYTFAVGESSRDLKVTGKW